MLRVCSNSGANCTKGPTNCARGYIRAANGYSNISGAFLIGLRLYGMEAFANGAFLQRRTAFPVKTWSIATWWMNWETAHILKA